MTEGNIREKMVRFAIPIFLGDLFQQLYNVVDALVVGNVLGKDALAAVTSTGSLVFLLVGFFGGMFSGVGVVISKFFGAGEKEKVKTAVGTAVAFGLIAGVILTIIGVFFTPTILKWMGTPDEVFHDAATYVRTYFAGILFVIMYNTANGIYRAIGDSKHPLYYLMVSSVVNVVLDFAFVAGLGMGVEGAAIATVISQAVSVCLAFYRLSRVQDVYRVEWKQIRLNKAMMQQMLRVGVPAGVQNSVIALANLVVQANINSFGSAAMAGSGAYAKIEGFAFIPITSFSMSLTTFISQNIGAGKYDRVKKGATFGVLTSILLAEIIGILFAIFAPQLIALFDRDPEVIDYGVARARIDAVFFCLLACSHAMAGVFRGAGKTIVPMFVMLACWCVIRVTYITIATSFVHEIQVIYWAYPLTWCLSSILFVIYYFKADWVHALEK